MQGSLSKQAGCCVHNFIMEKLKKSVEKLDPEAKKELIALSGSPQNASASTLLDWMLTISGFTGVLRSLSREELTVMGLIAESNGLQFSDLEKRASFPGDTPLDQILARLENLLLLYINKNRKHLNNRFDKIYIHSPLMEMVERFCHSPADTIRKVRDQIIDAPHAQMRDKANFLQTIYDHGAVLALADAEEKFGQAIDELIDSFSKKGLCRLVFKLVYPFSAFIILEAPTIVSFYEKEKKKNIALSVNNRYLLLNNINYCHDIISSFGFFLTQQNSFRKNDFKRLSDTMAPLRNFEGRELSNDDTTMFSLFCMDILKMLVVEKQIIFSDITPIADDFETPEKLTQRILTEFKSAERSELFAPPMQVPDPDFAMNFLSALNAEDSLNCEILRHDFVLEQYEQWFSRNDSQCSLPDYMTSTGDMLTWLVLLGLVQRNGTRLSLTQQGKGIFSSETLLTQTQSKELYINPDFTLLIQANEISDRLHYFLLNYCEIVQMDVMMQVKVTRESVSRAYKRGMNVDRLVTELENHSKNPVPQNLIFLIHEWVRQTVTVSLFFGAIIEVNTPTFLDNLEFHKSGKKILVSRISDTIAVVNVENVDEITRLAKKHNALVTIKLA